METSRQRNWMQVGLLGFLGVVLTFVGCTSKSRSDANQLNLALVANIKPLDPVRASDRYTSIPIYQIYEGLYSYHYLKRPYELEPNLAVAMPTVSSNKLVYTIKVRPGVVFQDDPAFEATSGKGRELTAEDVVYSFKRLADPKLLSDGWWIFDGKIKGLNEWREAQGSQEQVQYDQEVAGLKAVDRYTLRIELTQPSAQFLYYLAMPYTFIVPHEAVKRYGDDFGRNPVGTGPYRLVREESNLNSRLVFEKNPTVRELLYPSEAAPEFVKAGLLKDAGKKLPLVSRVVMEIIPESQPRWLKFMKGELDYLEIPKDNMGEVINDKGDLKKEYADKGIVLVKEPGLDITHYSFNMKDEVVGKNKKLRQAISMAVDTAQMIELFYKGRAIPAQGPIPPNLFGYDPNYKNPYRQFNVVKARELLREAGYPNGEGLEPIKVVSLSKTLERQMADAFSQFMAQIGVKVKTEYYTWPEFLNKVKNLDGQMWAYAWSADYPDAENFLQLFYGPNTTPGPNDSYYKNEQYDVLYRKLLTETRPEVLKKVYAQMRDILVEDAPWLWGVHRLNYYLQAPRIRNYVIHEFNLGDVPYLSLNSKDSAQEATTP